MDKDQIVRWFFRGVVIYALIGVICFGPATIQSERAYEDSRTQCIAEREGDKEGQRSCGRAGMPGGDGAFKALFWPLWLSYLVASKA